VSTIADSPLATEEDDLPETLINLSVWWLVN
jgi:hypothetical protein